ncbi:MAG: sugar phosphate nucleotidyltransferase [Melioribacteraceae bacterium]
MQAIILAGGKGTRLKPFTVTIPKPLMPIGDYPILEIVLRQLSYYNICNVVITVNHLASLIQSFFADGSKYGLKICYSQEEEFLGTAGPLSLITKFEDNFLVINGDLLTTIDFGKLFSYHLENNNDVTIVSYPKEVKIELGVLKSNNSIFSEYIEKPTYTFDISTGIYIFNRSCISILKKGEKLDMPDFISLLHQHKKKIMCYKGDFMWLDIGRVEEYEKANIVFDSHKKDFLKNT